MNGDGGGPERYRVYGIELESSRPLEAPLPRRAPGEGGGGCDLRLRWSAAAEPADDAEAEGERLWESPIRFSSGEPAVTLCRSGRRERICFTGVVEFVFGAHEREMLCRVLEPGHFQVVEIYFLGLVLAYWLERAGRLALHGSAVTVDGLAVAFLGDKGSGKSSLAASFLRDGCPLLTDDLLAVDVGGRGAEEREVGSSGSRPLAAPGYPQMRMWPDLVHHFVGDVEGIPPVEPGGRKRRVSLPDHWEAPFADAPAPLHRIYLPRRRAEGEGGGVRIEDVRSSRSVFELVRESFLVAILQATGLQGARLERLGRLVRAVQVRRLVYPSGLNRLREVRAAVRADLAEGSAGRGVAEGAAGGGAGS